MHFSWSADGTQLEIHPEWDTSSSQGNTHPHSHTHSGLEDYFITACSPDFGQSKETTQLRGTPGSQEEKQQIVSVH